jgi:hypothetical protein
MGAGWRMWRLSRLIPCVFWWQFVASLAWMQRTLVHCVMAAMSACLISFADLLMFPFNGFWGMCGENFYNAFLLLFIIRWVLILGHVWHVFLFLGLRLVGFFLFILFPFCFVVSTSCSCKTIAYKKKRWRPPSKKEERRKKNIYFTTIKIFASLVPVPVNPSTSDLFIIKTTDGAQH